MKLTVKYPLFIIGMVLATDVSLSAALSAFSSNALEKEITKRGLALARLFSLSQAPVLLAGDKSKLQIAVDTLLSGDDVVDAKVVNHRGIVFASKKPEDIGGPYTDFNIELELPEVVKLPQATVQDVQAADGSKVFGFAAPMKYGEVPLGVLVLTLSRRPIDEANARAVAFSGAIGLATAFIISLFALIILRQELKPIGDMQIALKAQAQGHFDSRMTTKRKDELGDLAQAFNLMSEQIELFLHYIDKSIIDRLVADPALAKPGGEIRELGVVFGDMRGYTAMSNRRTAQEVVRIINAYFYLFIEIVRHFGGVVDKTMGDAVMAFYEPSNNDDEDEYKRRAALAVAYMKASTLVLNKFIASRIKAGEDLNLEPCEFGFALACGKAIVGNMGSRHRMDYTVCGRVVNLASRLENETSRGEVVIDNYTRMAAGNILQLETLPTVQPKGFSSAEKVTPHRIIGLAEAEQAQMRRTLKQVFSAEFFSDHIVQDGFDGEVAEQWIRDAEMQVMEIIAGTQPEAFFEQIPLHEM